MDNILIRVEDTRQLFCNDPKCFFIHFRTFILVGRFQCIVKQLVNFCVGESLSVSKSTNLFAGEQFVQEEVRVRISAFPEDADSLKVPHSLLLMFTVTFRFVFK